MGSNIAARWCTACNGGPHSDPRYCPVTGVGSRADHFVQEEPTDDGTGTEPDGRAFASPNNSEFWRLYKGNPPWATQIPDERHS